VRPVMYKALVHQLLKEIVEWLRGVGEEPRARRQWFLVEDGDSYIRVYIRVGYHSLDGESLTTFLDIATITIKPEGEGIFTFFIEELEKLEIPYPLYVEEAIDFLGASLLKRGWLRRGDQKNYYLPIGKERNEIQANA
jgi:hypothetical protein